MMRPLRIVAAAIAGLLFAGGAALAHPHVWVTMKSEVVYTPDGSVAGVRHAWTFDDMYSAFALQGLDSKTPGVFTREELQPLAEVNATSLKEYGYFTFAHANGRKVPFVDPTDYHLELKDSLLTLYFMLPLKTPAKAQTLSLDIFDPTYFVDFSFADKNPVALQGAPPDCKFTVKGQVEATQQKVQRLSDDLADTTTAMNFGQQYAAKIAVNCP
jgi:ABC-type uncharacterized transport system substrate-binding protein